MEVVRGIKSPACHTRVRGLESLRLNWIYLFREKRKLAVTKTTTATKWVGGRLRPLFPEKRFPRRLMTYQFACRTQISRVLCALPAEAFGSSRFLQSMQLDLSLRDMFHLV
jgi:hypothetical protein